MEYENKLKKIIKFLLNNRAAVNAKDINSYTPLFKAVIYYENCTIMRYLLKRGANPFIINRDKKILIYEIVRNDKLKKFFIES